jgi:hypothetical protein
MVCHVKLNLNQQFTSKPEQSSSGGQGISSSHPNLMSSSLSSSSTLRPRVCKENSISISLMSILLLASSPFLLMELSIP